jgi:hypothetical protein
MNMSDYCRDYTVFFSLMRSLDQAFLARQGLADWHESEWGERFFSSLDETYPSWSAQAKEVYMTASHLLNSFAHPHTSPWTCASICNKPESLVRMVVLFMERTSVDVGRSG